MRPAKAKSTSSKQEGTAACARREQGTGRQKEGKEGDAGREGARDRDLWRGRREGSRAWRAPGISGVLVGHPPVSRNVAPRLVAACGARPGSTSAIAVKVVRRRASTATRPRRVCTRASASRTSLRSRPTGPRGQCELRWASGPRSACSTKDQIGCCDYNYTQAGFTVTACYYCPNSPPADGDACSSRAAQRGRRSGGDLRRLTRAVEGSRYDAHAECDCDGVRQRDANVPRPGRVIARRRCTALDSAATLCALHGRRRSKGGRARYRDDSKS